MNKRFLLSLIVAVIIISLGAAWAVYYNAQDEGSLSKGEIVLPGLREQLADVDHVQISSANAATYTLQSANNGWTVKERDNYPANFNKIRILLEQLSSAKFYEPKTATPDNYAVLGVADMTDKTSTGLMLKVFVKNNAEPYQLIVGKLATTWDGSYARLPNQAQSWLLDKQISADHLITAWLNNVVLAIEPIRIYKVTYTTPTGDKLVVEKHDRHSKRFTVSNLPVGKILRYDTIVDGVPHDFEHIVLKDVQMAAKMTLTSADTYSTRVQTYDGLVVDLQTQKRDNRYFLTLQSHYDADLAKTMQATDTELVNKAKADVDAIGKRAVGWVYEVNEHVYVDLTKTMKDVLPETQEGKESKPIEEKHAH